MHDTAVRVSLSHVMLCEIVDNIVHDNILVTLVAHRSLPAFDVSCAMFKGVKEIIKILPDLGQALRSGSSRLLAFWRWPFCISRSAVFNASKDRACGTVCFGRPVDHSKLLDCFQPSIRTARPRGPY